MSKKSAFKIIIIFSLCILFVSNLLSNNSVGYGLDTLKNYKKIVPNSCDPISEIILKNDSVLFSGYMVFKIKKGKNNKSNYFYCDIYFVNKECDIEPYLKYYYNFAPTAYLGYIGNDIIGDFVDSSNIGSPNEEFIKFKTFYHKYNHNVYEEKNENPFLSRLLTTMIFDNSIFWLSKKNRKTGYFIFKCEFYSAILNYYCKIRNKNIDVLLPISESEYFEPVNECDSLVKSDWFPEILK